MKENKKDKNYIKNKLSYTITGNRCDIKTAIHVFFCCLYNFQQLITLLYINYTYIIL